MSVPKLQTCEVMSSPAYIFTAWWLMTYVLCNGPTSRMISNCFNWKGCGRKYSQPNLRDYLGSCLEGMRKSTKTLEQDSLLLGWQFNLGCPKYKAGLPTTRTPLSVPLIISTRTPLPEHYVGSSGDVLATIHSDDTILIWSNLPFFVALIWILRKIPNVNFKHVIVAIWAHGHYHLCASLQHNTALTRAESKPCLHIINFIKLSIFL